MNSMHVKKGDMVKILSGDFRGKTGKIVRAMPREGKVVVEGVNIIKKHSRATREGQKGQVVERTMPIYACKVKKVEGAKA
jgi:large subunit ribosomal protein L24